MSKPDDYLSQIELALINSPMIAHYQIIRSWAKTDMGYIRFRATLNNSSTLSLCPCAVYAATWLLCKHNSLPLWSWARGH